MSEPKRTGRLAAAAALVAISAVSGAAAGQLSVAAPQATCLGETVAARAAEVVDVRSVRLDDGSLVRLAGIEPFALLSSESDDSDSKLMRRLTELLAGRPLHIQLASAAPDRYGRQPALVAIGDSLAQEVVAREGLAIAFAGSDALPCFDRILKAEAEARRAHRGFWTSARLPQAWPEALQNRIGRFAIFEGVVVSVGNRRATTYLSFGHRWSADVTIEIAAEDREKFGGEAGLTALAGRKVRARGYIEEKAGPMLTIHSPMQLEILGGPNRDGIAP